VPALAVSAELKKRGAEVRFVGSKRPEDRHLVEQAGFPFTAISTGKFRRYFSLQTLLEPFRAYAGYRQSLKLIKEFRPDVVFAKGGFAAVPVVRAAHRRKIPIVLHESDLVPGLANRIGARYAAAIAVSFPVDQVAFKANCPVVFTGNPLRSGAAAGRAGEGQRALGLDSRIPAVLVLGGSQGAKVLNQIVQDALPEILPEAQVVHQVGERWASDAAAATDGLPSELAGRYHYRGFFGHELFDLLAAADVVVSRAGAGGLAEIAVNGKASILVPLPSAASDHQRANAKVFDKAGAAIVLDEEKLQPDELARTIGKLLHDPTRRLRMGRAAKGLAKPQAAAEVAELVERAARGTLKESHG
jgi:UDP-N-acetylglucosamine--N-acetylmuramyl-(pentapeptide) pyrophosphoryl-undecaprenol N-acetylglucosamine transferase